MRVILTIIAFVILYGSLYPFAMSTSAYSTSGLVSLLDFDLFNSYSKDAFANVMVFIPFGLALVTSFRTTLNASNIFKLLVFTFVFAFAIQVIQLWVVGRVPWGGDALWNVLGCFLGIALYSLIAIVDKRRTINALTPQSQLSLFIALALISTGLAPFVPSLSFEAISQNITNSFDTSLFSSVECAKYVIHWMISFYLLKSCLDTKIQVKHCFYIVIVTFVLQHIIVDSTAYSNVFIGGIIAIVIHHKFSEKLPVHVYTLAILTSIFVMGISPFTLSNDVNELNVIPFETAISGNIIDIMLSYIDKVIVYCSAIWMLYLSTKRMLVSALIMFCFIFACEFSQRYFMNASADISDVLLILFLSLSITVVLRNLEKHAPLDLPFSAKWQTFRVLITKGIARYRNVVPMHNGKSYLAGLDGLRAIAAILVFFVHYQQFTKISWQYSVFDLERMLKNGDTGVALFFVLSGFLLSLPFWRQFEGEKLLNIKSYLVNRVVRIVPVYYVCLLLIMAMKGFHGSDLTFDNIVLHLLFLHTIRDQFVFGFSPPFWTLAVEFQFYLILPLLFWILFKLRKSISLGLCVIFGVASYLLYSAVMHYFHQYDYFPFVASLFKPFTIVINSPDGHALVYSLLANLCIFCIGIFAAGLYSNNYKVTPKIADLLFVTSSVTTFMILATPLDDVFQFSYARYNFPIVPLLLGVIVFTAPISRFAAIFLEFRPVRWLGVISYGIYVFHFPVLNSVSRVFARLDLVLTEHLAVYFIVATSITLFAAHSSFVLLEKPILQFVRSRQQR